MAILAPSPTNPMIITMSPLSVSAMGAPLPICCNNCDDKELKCKAHPHTKGSCYHCIVNGLQCLFPPITFLGHASPGTTNVSLFQRNCVHCTQSHQRCVFDTDSPTQCKRCIKLQVTCLFKLSSQGCRNDLIAPTDAIDPNWRPANANESVHYHHPFNGDSCHGCVDPVTVDDLGVCVERSLCPPPWVHVFAKSTQPSSIRTQAASIAYIEQPVHKKARHRRSRRSKKKLRKQLKLLTKVIVPTTIKQNLLSESDIENKVVVVDGGDDGNPPIRPPDGVNWRCLSVIGGNHLHVQDETNPCLGPC